MADFDPDSYLAQKTQPAPPSGFDPSAYLAAKTAPTASFDPDQYLAKKTAPQTIAQAPIADPVAAGAGHAEGSPEYEAAYAEDQAAKNRSFGEKTDAFAKTALTPSVWGEAAKGVGNFVTGLAMTPLHTAAEMAHGVAAKAGSAIGANDFATNQAQQQLRDKAEAVLAGQQIEEGLRNTGRIITNLKPSGGGDPYGSPDTMDAGMAETTPEQQKIADDRKARDDFNARIQHFQNQQQIQSGTPIDTGAVAALARVSEGGVNPSEALGTEALQDENAPAARPFVQNAMASAGDPQNLALAEIPSFPGMRYLGGKATELAGQGLQLPGKLVSAIPGKIGKTATGLGAAGIAAAETALHSPATAVGMAAGVGASKGLQWLGEGLEQQGKAAASGVPSALDTAAANARIAGQSALGTNAQRLLGDAATQGASTAIGMAPANAALSESPEDFARSTVGAGVFGAGLSALHSSRPALVEAARPALRAKGLQSLDTNSSEGRASAQFLQTLPEEQRNNALELSGALAGLPVKNAQGQDVPARMLVQSNAHYQKNLQRLGIQNTPDAGGRGFFWGPDGTAYINGENSSFANPQDAAQTMGHEFAGHAALNMLQAAGAKGGPIYDGLMAEARRGLFQPDGTTPTPEFHKFIDGYNKAFDPTGAHKELDPANQNSIDEFLSETAGRIISQKGTGEIALPKNILDHVTDGIGTFMSRLTGVDPRAVGTGGHFDRTEVASISKAVRDSLAQLAGMMRDGAALTPQQTPEQYVQQLQETLAKPKPTDTAANVQAWQKEQTEAAKALKDFQAGSPQQFPAAGKAPIPPSKPSAPSPAMQDATKGMVQLGIKPKEAQQHAQAAADKLGPNASASDILSEAVKSRQGTKNATPTTNQQVSPGATVATPVAVAPAKAVAAAGDTKAPAVAGGTGVEPAVEAPQHTSETASKVASDAEAKETADIIAEKKNPAAVVNQKRIRRAKLDALAGELGNDPKSLHVETDEDGNKKVVGNFDPSNPIHQEIAKLDGLTPEDAEKVDALQSAQGNPKYIRYRSATTDAIPEAGRADMEKRGKEYEADPAKTRTVGKIQPKVIIPLGTEVTSDKGGVVTKAFTLDNLLHNARSIFEAMKDAGIKNPYEGDAKGAQLIADAQAYARNHANGVRGDGSGPIQQFPDSNLPTPSPGYEPTAIPKDRFDVLNMMMHDEGSSKVADLTSRAVADQAAGKDTPSSRATARQLSRAKESYALAEENKRFIDPDSGETNQLRKQLRANGFNTGKSFKSPFETLAPQHILEMGDAPLAKQAGDIPSVRPTGFDADPAELAKEGLPNSKAVRAGFMPDAQTPQERAQGRMEDRERDALHTVSVGDAKLTPAAQEIPMPSFLPNSLHHGTPHDFDKFDSEKIGSGEGNQAYGHGFYLAENPGVAKEYAKTLGGDKGNVLQAKVTPPESSFLEWDKDIADQSPEVKASLSKTPVGKDIVENQPWVSGKFAYEHLGINKAFGRGTPKDVSEGLSKLGIAGIQYLDQGSRAPDSFGQTRNYVIFDPNDIEITHKNGEPVTPKERAQAGFMPDSGTPAEGGTPSERLTREAEAAGVVLKTEDLKNLIRMDPATVARIRSRIEQNTGQKAQFRPDEKLTPESLISNIRSYGADISTGRTAKDYSDSIAAHFGANAGGGEDSKAFRGAEQDAANKALIQWADENRVAIRGRRPYELNPTSKRNVGNSEHDVFEDSRSGRWIKTTQLGQYGKYPVAEPNGKDWSLKPASPAQYVERLKNTEKMFDIKTPVHAVLVEPTVSGKVVPSIVTSQPDIQGENMDEAAIEKSMKSQGFLKIDDSAYYRPSDNTAILDAHPGNLKMVNGKPAGYDAIVAEPKGALKELFNKLHAKASNLEPPPEYKGSFMDAARARQAQRQMAVH